jgi:hypothetical protein
MVLFKATVRHLLKGLNGLYLRAEYASAEMRSLAEWCVDMRLLKNRGSGHDHWIRS